MVKNSTQVINTYQRTLFTQILKDKFYSVLFLENLKGKGLPVEGWMTNLQSSLHGGAISTIIDTATTLNILMNDQSKSMTTSIELNTSFIKGKLLVIWCNRFQGLKKVMIC